MTSGVHWRAQAINPLPDIEVPTLLGMPELEVDLRRGDPPGWLEAEWRPASAAPWLPHIVI